MKRGMKTGIMKRILVVFLCVIMILPNVAADIQVFAAEDTDITEKTVETQKQEESKTENQGTEDKKTQDQNTEDKKTGNQNTEDKKTENQNTEDEKSETQSKEDNTGSSVIEKETEEEIKEDAEKDSVSENTVTENTVLESTVSENTVSENIVETVSQNEVKEVAFDASVTIGGIRVKVTADKGVFPEGATLRVIKIENKDQQIKAAIEGEAAKQTTVKPLVAFDITVLDENKEEIQPNTDKGNVKVTFENVNTSEADEKANTEIKVYHIEDSMEKAEPVSGVEAGNGEVSFEAEHFSIYAVATELLGGTGGTEVGKKNLANGVKLTVSESSKDNVTSVTFNKTYMVMYSLLPTFYISNIDNPNFTNGDTKDYYYVKCGETYQLPSLPRELELHFMDYMTQIGEDEYSWPAEAYFEANGQGEKKKQYGTIVAKVNADGSTSVSIKICTPKDMGVGEDEIIEISDAYLGMAVQLDRDVIQNSENIDLSFEELGIIIPVQVEENKKDEPSVEKTALSADDFESTREILWTITVTNGKNPAEYTEGITIKDVIPNDEKHSFVEGSLKKYNEEKAVWESVSASYDAASRTMTYTDADYDTATANGTTKYQYRTKVEGNLYLSEGTVSNETITPTRTNGVSLLDASVSEEHVIATTSATWRGEAKTYNWGKKEALQVDEDGYVTWRVTVDTNGYHAKNLTIYDCMSEHFTQESAGKVIIDYKDVTVEKNGKEKKSLTSGITVEAGKQNDRDYNMTFKLGDISASESPVILTYKAKIQNYDNYVNANNKENPKNTAWPEFDVYENGEEEGSGGSKLHIVGPLTEGDTTAKLSSHIIRKEALGYNAVTQEIAWKVTVNPNRVKLTEAVVTDLLDLSNENIDFKQSFVRIEKACDVSNSAWVHTGENTLELSEMDDTGKIKTESYHLWKGINYKLVDGNPQIKFGKALSGKQAQFVVITKLKEDQSNIFAGNTIEEEYHNLVRIDAKGQGGKELNAIAEATQRVKSEVFNKSDGEYNYATHELTWNININHGNKMAMSNIVVTDELRSLICTGVSVKSGTGEFVEIQKRDSAGSTGTKPYYTYGEENGLVTVYLADIPEREAGTSAAMRTVQIITKVDDTKIDYTKDNEFYMFENYAELTNNYTTKPIVSNKAEAIIANDVLTKIGEKDTDNNEITYLLLINRAQMKLPANAMLKDTMSAGLQLQPDTVKLHEAIVESNGEMEPGAPVDSGAYTTKVTYENGETTLCVSVPATDKAYMLIYKAHVTAVEGMLNNKVTFTGDNYSAEESLSYDANDFSDGRGSKLRRVVITKKDTEGNKLSGAVFAIQQKNGETGEYETKATATTNGSGTITFYDLEKDAEYRVIEISAPRGYLIDETHKFEDFKAPENGGSANAVTFEFVNTKQNGRVSFLKTGDAGELLPDAVFGLYQVNGEEETALNITKTSDAFGKVEFTQLKEGTYHIKEEAPPEGYRITTNVYVVVVDRYGEVTGPYLLGDETGTVVESIVNEKNTEENPENPDESGGGDSGGSDSGGGSTPVTYNPGDSAVLGATRTPGIVTIPEEPTALAPGVLGADRLPKTGGFWGTGIIYIMGAIFILAGVLLFFYDKKKMQVLLAKIKMNK